MAKEKQTFFDALQDIKNTTEQEVNTKTVLQEARTKNPVGRPSHKLKTKKYSKVIAYIEKEYKDKLQILMLTELEGEYISLSEYINDIVGKYLENRK